MALSPADRRTRRLLLALALTSALLPVQAQRATLRGNIRVTGEGGGTFNLDNHTTTLRKFTLRQGEGTLIVADLAVGAGGEGTDGSDEWGDSRWEVSGSVRIEHEGVTLEADSAVAVFVNSQLRSVDVKGAPASFSRPTGKAGRTYQGRANVIEYDVETADIRFDGKTRWTDGQNVFNTEALTYNVRENTLDTDQRTQADLILRPERRVPPPATPDRSQAP